MHSNQYVLPNGRLEITKKSFFPSTTRDWNNLSPEIRNSGNINIFKRKFKILLEKVSFYFGWGDRKIVPVPGSRGEEGLFGNF
jgi:hypothetical protein